MNSPFPAVAISGAAGAIGSAVAAAFAARGFYVLGVDQYSLEEACDRGIREERNCPIGAGRYEHIVADLSDENAMRLVEDRFEQAALQHAVSVAGGADSGEIGQWDITGVSTDSLSSSIANNLLGQMVFAKAVLPSLRKHPPASLAFTSSINGVVGAGLHAYSAAKAGLISLTRTLAVAEAEYGVRVNAVAPGTVITPRTQKEWSGHPEHFDKMNESTALGRCATPEEIAATFVSLSLDMTAITGQTLVVDAGQCARWR